MSKKSDKEECDNSNLWYAFYNIPLCLVMHLWRDHVKALRTIQCYGIVHFANRGDISIEEAQSRLCVSPIIDETEIMQEYEAALQFVEREEGKYGKQPFAGISANVLNSFIDEPQEIELLAGYIAIRSIIGEKNFIGTNKKVITMRMIGIKNNEELNQKFRLEKEEKLKASYDKFNKRWHFDRLIMRLQARKLIKGKITLPNGRLKSTMYFSFKYTTEQLGKKISEQRNTNKMKAEEVEARRRIRAATKANIVPAKKQDRQVPAMEEERCPF